MFSHKDANRIIAETFVGKTPLRPVFYIKYGPPASGKSSIMRHVLDKDSIPEHSLVTVDVDAIMARSTEYTEELEGLIAQGAGESKLQSHYKHWRVQADLISDEILNKAISDGYNIAWETTGNTIAWTVRVIRNVLSKGYRVVVVYPLVPTSILVERGVKRTMQVMAPVSQISDMAVNAARNIKRLLPHVDGIYVYDNTGTKATIIIEVERRYPGSSESEATGGVLTVSTCDYKRLKNDMAQLFAAEINEVLQHLCYINSV